MFENENDMALSIEDIAVLIIGGLAFLLTFSDIMNNTQAAISFPAIILFLIGWVLVRFRRRPLPKQVHSTRSFYLVVIRSIRNYALFSIIFQNILLLSGYTPSDGAERVVTIYNFVILVVASIFELAGHITVPDTLYIFERIEGETDEELKKKRFQILFGLRFWVWISITSIIFLGLMYLPMSQAVFSLYDGKTLILVFQILSILFGGGLFVFTYFRTMSFDKLESPDMIIKAVEYYNTVELRERSYELLEDFVQNKSENLGLMSKLAVMYTQDEKHEKVLDITRKILDETEEKEINVPHMIARAHLLRAISFKAIENYKIAYEEVTKSLHYIPENNIARKLRRDLRKILKIKKQENKEE